MVPHVKDILGLRSLPIFAAAAVIASASCKEEKTVYAPNVGDGESTPTMLTIDVDTYVSDSGYTRYHITAPVWAMYEDARVPNWKFPEGLKLDQLDRELNVTAKMRCDSATYFSQKRLWRLDGNVQMVNTANDSFASPQVFWDQNEHTIRSDSFIHIVRADRIIEGYGFNSNEQMTEYFVNRPTGIFPVGREAAKAEPDSAIDSNPRRRRPHDSGVPAQQANPTQQ